MKKETVLLILDIFLSFSSMQRTEGINRCVIIQDKMSIDVPFEHPSFLKQPNKTQCQQSEGRGMLRCGMSDVYIKPECVCTFHNVYEATLYHQYSSCPHGEGSDVVTQLKCLDCKIHSLNNNGPCINGGKLTCIGNEVAPAITCECPPNYKGKFCEEKMENVTRQCDKISASSAVGLRSCDLTKRDCVTYSRTGKYAYKCKETDASQDRQGLPLCIDTEDITGTSKTSTNTTDSSMKNYLISGIQVNTPTPAVMLQSSCSNVNMLNLITSFSTMFTVARMQSVI